MSKGWRCSKAKQYVQGMRKKPKKRISKAGGDDSDELQPECLLQEAPHHDFFGASGKCLRRDFSKKFTTSLMLEAFAEDNLPPL